MEEIDIYNSDFVSAKEIAAYERCAEVFGSSGHVYLVTETCPGAGYELVYSMHPLEGEYSFDPATMKTITDIDNLLENF